MSIAIRSDEHIFIAGRTGSGKTTLARYLLREVRRLIVCDSKGTLSNWSTHEWGRAARRALMNGQDIRIRVVPPVELADTTDFWNDIFLHAYSAGGVRVYVDELGAIMRNAQNAPHYFNVILSRGREFHVSACTVTQRPASVPLLALSEASHYFCFRLNLRDDRQRMAQFMGEEVLENIKDKYGFWYFGAELNAPQYFKDLRASRAGG